MQLIIHIPDDMIDDYRHVLPPPEMGVLEDIACDAIFGAIDRFANSREGESGN